MSISSDDRQEQISKELLSILGETVLDISDTETIDSDLFDLGLDSMGIMHLILVIEERYTVSIAPADVTRDQFETTKRIASLITQRQEAS